MCKCSKFVQKECKTLMYEEYDPLEILPEIEI